jgi:hypothetical protein
MVVELYKYMELSTEFSATAPYILIGTGALIILVGSLACCCTVKGQPVLLYTVSNNTPLHLQFWSFKKQEISYGEILNGGAQVQLPLRFTVYCSVCPS